MITPSVPTVVAPTIAAASGGGGGGRGGGGVTPQGFGSLPGGGSQNLRLDFATGQFVPFADERQRQLPDTVNITVNTVSADANLPNLIVEALQQYNLVSGPLDVQIAA